MTTFPVLQEGSLTPGQAALWHELNASHRAVLTGGGAKKRMPDLFNAWLHFPEFARQAFAMADTLRAATAISDKLRELVILTVSMQLKTRVEYDFHVPIARANGVPDAVISAIGDGVQPRFSDPVEALFHQASLELASTSTLSEKTRAGVVEAVGHNGLMVLINLYTLVATTSNVAQVELHEDFSADEQELDAFYKGELASRAKRPGAPQRGE